MRKLFLLLSIFIFGCSGVGVDPCTVKNSESHKLDCKIVNKIGFNNADDWKDFKSSSNYSALEKFVNRHQIVFYENGDIYISDHFIGTEDSTIKWLERKFNILMEELDEKEYNKKNELNKKFIDDFLNAPLERETE